MRKVLYFFIALFININVYADMPKPLITDYKPVFIPCFNRDGYLRVAIRMYYRETTPYFIAVNPYTFATETAPVATFAHRRISNGRPIPYLMRELAATPYMQALMQYTSPPYVQNYGVMQAFKPVNGEFLTIDMCPSVRPFESGLFNALIAMADQLQRSIPIGISVTGLWMLGHPAEFNWLIQQQESGKLQITWINHSFSHVYFADLPPENNFLLLKLTNVKHEILATEKILVQNHQLPSVFFRFPGLVSDRGLILRLRHYGLIPVSTNAWLANGGQIKNGSIILVHGNSNEPLGIKAIMPVLPSLKLLPLNQAF